MYVCLCVRAHARVNIVCLSALDAFLFSQIYCYSVNDICNMYARLSPLERYLMETKERMTASRETCCYEGFTQSDVE